MYIYRRFRRAATSISKFLRNSCLRLLVYMASRLFSPVITVWNLIKSDQGQQAHMSGRMCGTADDQNISVAHAMASDSVLFLNANASAHTNGGAYVTGGYNQCGCSSNGYKTTNQCDDSLQTMRTAFACCNIVQCQYCR
jgi:hypothetical protein